MTFSSTTWQRDERVLWRHSLERTVLLPPSSDGQTGHGPTGDEPLVLEGTARIIWDLLEQPMDGADLAARLAGIFDSPREEIETEVAGFLRELAHAGALVSR